MLEKRLQELIKEAKEIRNMSIENNSASYFKDVFHDLSDFIISKLNDSLFSNINIKEIANHFDEILPYVVSSNINILIQDTNKLVEQPGFKEKFIKGLKKYPYKDKIDKLLYFIWAGLNNNPNQFDTFIDSEILNTLSIMDLNGIVYLNILNKLNENNQREFLKLLIKNKCNIHYLVIEYKGNSRQIIYDNIDFFIENARNLYALKEFVKDNPNALSQVKNYINNNNEKAINSIFYGTDFIGIDTDSIIKDPTIKEIVKLIIFDVMKNENIKFSDITYTDGGFSRILLIGDKVIKIGGRVTKIIPNNPYIVTPLLRREFNINDETCFVEVTERVDTSKKVSKEELYQLFKNLRNLGLIWTDICETNAGYLKRKNIIHWRENIEPSEEVLELENKRGTIILEEGDLVVLDADFIFDENDSDIDYSNKRIIYDEFENRYQDEIKYEKENFEFETNIETGLIDFDINDHKGIHR